MRTVLLVLAWSGLFGIAGDGALALFAAWLIVEAGAGLGLSVDGFLRDFVPVLYWVKELARSLLPSTLVDWLFGLPALVYFPARVAINLAFSWAMFALARRV